MAAKTFVRKLDPEICKCFTDSNLYKCCLKEDILSGKAFPAIRNNRIDLYHAGGKLFGYAKDFATHVKYASVLTGTARDYVTEKELKGENPIKLIKNFVEGYDRIKENCSLYAGVESNGVSCLYSKYSYLIKESRFVVLDIEVSFAAIDNAELKADDGEEGKPGSRQDRIDLLVYDTTEKILRFYEAKHFSNKEIWSKEKTKPRVVNQVTTYQDQIKDKNDEILDAYQSYVKLVNGLFELDLPEPEKVDGRVPLLVFGFDSKQKKKIDELLVDDGSLDGLHLYSFGGAFNDSSFNIKNMWNAIK